MTSKSNINLSASQHNVLVLTGRGLSVKQISNQLKLGEARVKDLLITGVTKLRFPSLMYAFVWSQNKGLMK